MVIKCLSRASRGFTLIELSIVLIIAGLLTAGIARAYDIYIKKQKVEVTQQRLEDVYEALAQAVQNNGFLPCPSDRSISEGQAGYGSSAAAGLGLPASDPYGDCSQVPASAGVVRVVGRAGRQVRIGSVPFLDLGLTAAHMYDGYGRRLTYAVTEALATSPASYDNDEGAIDVVDGSNTSVLTTTGAGTALYMVVSHGADGRGAYSSAGVPFGTACADGTPGTDVENCNDDATFKDDVVRTVGGATHFDDVMVHSHVVNSEYFCGNNGMIYGPSHPARDLGTGCLPDLKVGNLTTPASTDDGFVGIGTANPTSKLHVVSTNTQVTIASSAPAVTGQIYTGTSGGMDRMVVGTTSNNSLSLIANNITAMTIDGAGRVGVGTTGPTERLDVSGNIHATGTIYADSDIRFKRDLKPLTGVMDSLDKLTPMTYVPSSLGVKRGSNPDKRQLGISAQELEKVFPELVVVSGAEQYRAVDYSRMTVILLEAVKELREENKAFKLEIDQLHEKLERMEQGQTP